MITSRLLLENGLHDSGLGHSFVLEFHPVHGCWYIFQAFQGLCEPRCARIPPDEFKSFLEELMNDDYMRLLSYANIDVKNAVRSPQETKTTKTRWTFMCCIPTPDYTQQASIYTEDNQKRNKQRDKWIFSLLLFILFLYRLFRLWKRVSNP